MKHVLKPLSSQVLNAGNSARSIYKYFGFLTKTTRIGHKLGATFTNFLMVEIGENRLLIMNGIRLIIDGGELDYL